MTNFSILKAWRAASVITLGVAVLLGGLAHRHAYAQQDPSRQLVQTNEQRPTGSRRIALVIGNGAYTSAPPLKNPPNDARDMAANLKTLGFEVSSGVNVSQREMKRLIREFGQKLKSGGSGLFYYAGHGVQARGRNYIIPVDAEIQSEADVEDSGVDVGLVLNYMDDAQNGLNIVILDACRNNPFSRSFRSATDGLAQVDAPTGTLIAYATAPGRVAADGAGENGLYTSELLRAMRVPGLTATDMFMQVRGEVMKKTGNKQVPWEASSLVGAYYFSGGPTNLSSSNSGDNSPASSETKFDAAAFEYNYWDSIKNSTSADDFKAYLAKYPSGQFADLARNRIKSLEVAARPAEASPGSSGDDSKTEVAFWDYIKNSSNVEDFQAYLKKYPDGAFSDLANNRIKALEAAIKEKDKVEEAKRLEAEAAKPIKTYDVEVGKKDSLTGEAYDSAKLIFLTNKFHIERDPEGLRAESKIYASIYKEDFETALERQKKFYEHWDCIAFKAARTDKLIIREIQPRKNDPWRLRFKSPAEAAEALTEIQRLCKANP
jgi:TolA-binding protein